MKIIVCVKQVPSSSDVRLHPVDKTIIRDGKQAIINPFDMYAVEAGLQIKDQLAKTFNEQTSVTAMSMGIPETERLLKDVLGRGVDHGVLLSDRAFAGSDTLATSYVLAEGVKSEKEVDLIICGKMAVDGDTAQIGPELAEHIGIPHLTDVTEIKSVSPREIICKKATDYGYQIITMGLPALITVVKDINLPRLPSIEGVLSTEHAEIIKKDAGILKTNATFTGLKGSPTQVVKTFVPDSSVSSVKLDIKDVKTAAVLGKVIEEVCQRG